ncbi:hypothetical protein ACJX0J_034489, partial [Zea mays]
FIPFADQFQYMIASINGHISPLRAHNKKEEEIHSITVTNISNDFEEEDFDDEDDDDGLSNRQWLCVWLYGVQGVHIMLSTLLSIYLELEKTQQENMQRHVNGACLYN